LRARRPFRTPDPLTGFPWFGRWFESQTVQMHRATEITRAFGGTIPKKAMQLYGQKLSHFSAKSLIPMNHHSPAWGTILPFAAYHTFLRQLLTRCWRAPPLVVAVLDALGRIILPQTQM
jgi:hypothetical protein